MMKVADRIKHAWNAFTSNSNLQLQDHGYSSSRPTHKTPVLFNTSSYVSSIYNRIAVDVSMTSLKHVKIDKINEDITDLDSGLNSCLTIEANIDQSHIQFIHDLVYSMFDEGVVAVVPTEITLKKSGGIDIDTLRVGKIVKWFPKHIEVNLYNELTGQNENIILEKSKVAIIENPLYSVVNAENSTLKRLIKKINQLDRKDNSADADRLDLLINVPYSIKTDAQLQMAENRIKNIEAQLSKGRHGIAYIDATEKATQLSRPIDSQLPGRISELTQEFYNQLGLTQAIFNGTATEAQMRTYYSRSIDPILENIVSEFRRKFLTKTARSQGHTIMYYRDMFKMVPVEQIVQLGDTFRRNEIASSNEIRRIIGLKPSNDPRADELANPNIAARNQEPIGGLPTDAGYDIEPQAVDETVYLEE